VIIDEAHNLIDAINQMYSVELTAKTLAQVRPSKKKKWTPGKEKDYGRI
jgi:hypothetical protein